MGMFPAVTIRGSSVGILSQRRGLFAAIMVLALMPKCQGVRALLLPVPEDLLRIFALWDGSHENEAREETRDFCSQPTCSVSAIGLA